MGLKERVYSILLVSSIDKFNASLRQLLPESRFNPLHIASGINESKRVMAEKAYDFVIINYPVSDDDGIRFAIDTSSMKNTVVLLLVRSEIYIDIFEKVVDQGVFVLSKPIAKTVFYMIIDWMATARERIRMHESRTQSLEEKMAEIRLVNRAKLLLISEMNMDEPMAHRYIEKQAMDRCVNKRIIAEEIIKKYT